MAHFVMSPTIKHSPVTVVLAITAIAVMVVAYFLPVWWVSLRAPNYPQDTFPDGIRIHFGFHGVTNGCKTVPAKSRRAQEVMQEDLGWRTDEGDIPIPDEVHAPVALDCVHEMNTINHYVGMHPIEVGAPVERQLAKYIIGMFAVALLGFAIASSKVRVWAMSVGFMAVSTWMFVELFGYGSLDAAVGVYVAEAGKYFNDADRIANWGMRLRHTTIAIAFSLVIFMAFVSFAAFRWLRFQLILAVLPALLPVFFVGIYAGWLWFFGHNMHPWGAFTLKPFMPTVFGDGQVAQFTTRSYPHIGFAVLAMLSVLLFIAIVRRRNELLDASSVSAGTQENTNSSAIQ